MERKQIFERKEGGNRPETFAMVVEGYDLKAVPPVAIGKRLDNEQVVRVSLREVTYNQRGRYARSEIADFASPRKTPNHPGTEPGGTLLIQEAFRQRDGSFAARWIQSLSHTAGEAEVFTTTIHVGPVRYGKTKTATHPNGKPFAVMTMLHDGDFRNLSDDVYELMDITPPFKVDSVAQLEEAAAHLVESDIGVGVRVSNESGFDAMFVSRMSRGGETSVADAVASFMKEIEPVAAQIDSGALKCEVVPYGNIFGGPATVEIMLDNPVVQGRLKQFNAVDSDARGRTYPRAMYREAIVAVRATGSQDDRGVFFTHFEPLWTRQPVVGLTGAIAYAKTKLLAPEPPKPETVADPAISAAGDTASFDANSEADADLMAAAGATAPNDIGDDIPAQEATPAVDQPRPAPASSTRSGRYGGRRMANA